MREITEQSENEKQNEDVSNSEGRIKNVEISNSECRIKNVEEALIFKFYSSFSHCFSLLHCLRSRSVSHSVMLFSA
jgi:hypothetical protein